MNRWKNYGLWVSIAAFIPLVAQSFGWNFIPDNYNDLVNGLLSILVLAGILSNPKEGPGYLDEK